MKEDEPTTRHRELSLMFLKMGRTLVDEGMKNKDYITATLGNAMIFISSTTFDIEEVKQFGELCNMMSSRRLVKGIRDGSFDMPKFDGLGDVAKNDPFQEVLRKIKRDLDNGEDNPNDK